MADDRSGGEAEFTIARPGQLSAVRMVLDEAAAWLQERGIEQWPPRFERAGFAYRGDFTVAGAPGQRLGGGPVTVVSRYELGLTHRATPCSGRRAAAARPQESRVPHTPR